MIYMYDAFKNVLAYCICVFILIVLWINTWWAYVLSLLFFGMSFAWISTTYTNILRLTIYS